MKRVFFQKSDSCRNLSPEDISFILEVLWKENAHIRTASLIGESDWTIRLETQRYIDRYSNIHGCSASFPYVTPKITLLSLEEWTERPEPKSAFYSQISFRKFLILREYYKAFRIPNTLFRGSADGSFNNEMIKDASNSEWMIKDYKSSSRTKLGRHSGRTIPPSLLEDLSQQER